MKKWRNIKETIKRMGLRKKTIAWAMSLFITAILLSGIAFSAVYYRMRQDTIERTLNGLVMQKEQEIERYFNDLESLAYEVGCSTWMQSLINNKGYSGSTMQELVENVEYVLGSIANMNHDIRLAAVMNNGIRVRGPQNKYIDYSIDFLEAEWYEEFVKEGKYFEQGTGKGIYTRGEEWYLNIYYPINNQYTFGQEGILIFTLNKDNISDLIHLETEDTYVTLRDQNGNILDSDIQEIKKKEHGYVTRTGEIDVGGQIWTVEVTLNTENIAVDSRNIWIGFGGVFVLAAVLFFSAAVLFSKYLTVPILKCRDAMNKIRDNQMGITIENGYYDEIGELIRGFNDMSSSIYDLIEKNKIMSVLQKETEYQMLQQQINPHFLYNTLEIINGLITSGKEQEAMEVCENLGRIFRYNLKQDKWVSIQEEVNYIKEYLTIMMYRIPGLSVYYQIDESAESGRILKSVLQPLVENSIKHGFALKREDCCITLSMQLEGDKRKISIMDNGSGMDRETYASLMKGLQDIRENPNEEREMSVHIGVRNVFHRLYLEYGEQLEFCVISREGMGTRVQIELPERNEDV